MSAPRRVLAVAMDAADAGLVLRWTREGRLPVLGRLLERGGHAALRSGADYFPETIWPTVATGREVGQHGIYNWRMIRPGTYERAYAPLGRDEPFWAGLGDDGVIAFDVPYTAPLRRDGITEVAAWGQRGVSAQASWPPDLLQRITARHGRYPEAVHHHHHRRPFATARLLRTLERMADARADAVAEVMAERPWSLCLVNYAEPHDAGHEFHRHVGKGGRFSDALLRAYQAVDRGVGRLAAAAGDDATVVVFSGMGLRENGTGEQLLTGMMERLGHQVPAGGAGSIVSRPVNALRRAVPWSVRLQLHLRLSPEQQDKVMVGIWLGGIDWARTRAFAESEPHCGWIRLNVRGREPQGIVAPGAEYEALRERIVSELGQVVDAETGEPAVDVVLRREELDGASGPRADELPDLAVRWTNRWVLRAVRHPTAGEVHQNARDVPWTEHHGDGFLVAAGPGVAAGAEASGRIVDVAPSLLALLGREAPAAMEGRPLEPLIAVAPPPPRAAA